MRICLTPRVGGGGPASFQQRLQAEFQRLGVETTFDPRERPLDAVLVFAGTKDLPALAGCRRGGVRIVQRLNGINWMHRIRPRSAAHFLRGELWNLQLRIIRSRFADRIVYQSDFARAWWERAAGIPGAGARIVHNGVALDEYPPARDGHDRTLLVVEANLDDHGPARAILRSVHDRFVRSGRLTGMCIYTRLTPSLEREWSAFDPRPETPGMRPRPEVRARQIRAALFLTMDLNPSCPNSVIEALAAGLPVVGFDTGSVGEIVGAGGIVVRYDGDPWKLEIPRNLGELEAAGTEILGDWPGYSRRARSEAERRFDIRTVAQSYLETLSG
jgi:glycosyltransferase involved in cell wall biosynthesis